MPECRCWYCSIGLMLMPCEEKNQNISFFCTGGFCIRWQARPRVVFEFLTCFTKCYIFVVNAKPGWLQNADGMHMVDVSRLSIGQQGLKGQCHEIFCFRFFLEKSYLNPLNHLYRLQRLQRHQRYRWQNLPPVSLIPVPNLPLVLLTPVVHLDFRISPRIFFFEKIRNNSNQRLLIRICCSLARLKGCV